VAKASNVPIFMGHSVGELVQKKDPATGKDVVANFKLFILHYMVYLLYGWQGKKLHRGVQISLNLPHGHEIANDFESQLLLLSEQASKESPHLEYSLMVSKSNTRSAKIEAFHLLSRVEIVMWTSRGRLAQLRYPICSSPP
jgi:hypothetical protein